MTGASVGGSFSHLTLNLFGEHPAQSSRGDLFSEEGTRLSDDSETELAMTQLNNSIEESQATSLYLCDHESN